MTSDANRQLASLPQAIVLLAPGQTVASANPAAEQFFGQSLRRLTNRPLTDLMQFDQSRLGDRLAFSDVPLSARDVSVVVGGIGRRRFDMTISPLLDQPGWQVLTLHDSTAVEAMGEEMGSGDDKVLRGPEILAHEIKNPLAGIRGAAQLLERKLGEGDRKMTRLIVDEVDRIAKLIDQMQTLSQRTPEPVSPCNLHEAVRRALAVMAAASQGVVHIEEEFDPSLPSVLGSLDGLVQVLINLISNASEAACAEQAPRVMVRTRFASGLQLHALDHGTPVRLPIELRVSDNGPGVTAALREHIFEPFVTSKKSGQGLGLALVRKLVRDMNGRIVYERDEAAGWTHLRVQLPMAEKSRPPGQGRSA